MIKTMLLASFLMAFTFIAIPTQAKADCKKCKEAQAHYDKMEKKKPCEKMLDKKPCHKKEKKIGFSKSDNNKGSLTFKSSPGYTGGTATYND